MTRHLKIFAVIIAILLLFSFTGCKESANTSLTASPQPQVEFPIQAEAVAENVTAESQMDIIGNDSVKKTQAIKESETLPDPPTTNRALDDASQSNICTLSVKCDNALKNSRLLSDEKLALLPDNGIIYYKSNVTFYEDESVFNVLSRELKKNKIHFEFSKTPAFNSAYIEGICNLYEFDCGELSGWTYRINGKTPGVGCSLYKVKASDIIEFIYTCGMGQDMK